MLIAAKIWMGLTLGALILSLVIGHFKSHPLRVGPSAKARVTPTLTDNNPGSARLGRGSLKPLSGKAA